MTPQELKNSILQLAIQGKLVEQRPQEGTAEELYQQIREEKRRLMKEGKIKKEKPLPEISENEVPFEIPGSWKWVRLVDLCKSIADGDHQPPPQVPTGIPFLVISNVSSGMIDFSNTRYVPKDYFKALSIERIAEHGDILFTVTGSYGISIKVDCYQPFCFQRHIALLKLLIDWDYIFYLLQSPQVKSQCDEVATGTAQKTVGLKSLKALILPLPPLAEQKRIAAKIEDLLPYIDRYEQAWSRLETLNKRFPEDMKKSLLQQAIQGKLVEQQPEEGTAEGLYQQIQVEKRRLVKEGKIKKEKPLPEIAEDEVPFEIPGSWKWVRLSQISILENGDRSNKYPVERDYVDFGIPFFGAKDMKGLTMSFDNVRYISKEKFSELGNGKLKDKDFVCLLRGAVGKCAIFAADEQHKTGFICAQMVIVRCISKAVGNYLQMFLLSPYYSQYIESKVTGTAVRQLPAKELGGVLIPLPPLTEQKRIVAKLEELLPLCERIKEVIK